MQPDLGVERSGQWAYCGDVGVRNSEHICKSQEAISTSMVKWGCPQAPLRLIRSSLSACCGMSSCGRGAGYGHFDATFAPSSLSYLLLRYLSHIPCFRRLAWRGSRQCYTMRSLAASSLVGQRFLTSSAPIMSLRISHSTHPCTKHEAANRKDQSSSGSGVTGTEQPASTAIRLLSVSCKTQRGSRTAYRSLLKSRNRPLTTSLIRHRASPWL